MSDEQEAASLRYRPDIEGLRALAVIPVCFFHLGLPGFPGGFVGFYERRALRLLPALFTVLFVTTIATSLWITPKLFNDFASMLCGTALFSSNLVLWRMSANYFSASTDWNPLVHTWSLSVEEQFYLFFPLLLILIWRMHHSVRIAIVALIGSISVALSIWGTANAPTATFYLLPMRAWELLMGALAGLVLMSDPAKSSNPGSVPRAVRVLACVTGLALIVGSMVLFDREMVFPGAAALVPCTGATVLLVFGVESSNPTLVPGLHLCVAWQCFPAQQSVLLHLRHSAPRRWPATVGLRDFTTSTRCRWHVRCRPTQPTSRGRSMRMTTIGFAFRCVRPTGNPAIVS